MKKTTKAMLLSLLVFPGSGHLVFRRWWRGNLIMLAALVLLIIYIRNSIIQAGIVVDKILAGEVAMDILSIYKGLHDGPEAGGLLLLAVSAYGFLLLWILAAIDVYRLGRK